MSPLVNVLKRSSRGPGKQANHATISLNQVVIDARLSFDASPPPLTVDIFACALNVVPRGDSVGTTSQVEQFLGDRTSGLLLFDDARSVP